MIEPMESRDELRPVTIPAYWVIRPNTVSNLTLIGLTFDTLRVVNGKEEKIAALIRDLESGAPQDVVLAKATHTAPLKKVLAIIANEKESSLEVRYTASALSGGGAGSVRLQLADPSLRNEIFEHLHSAYGETAQVKRAVFSPIRAAVSPCVGACITILIASFVLWLANHPEELDDRHGTPKGRAFSSMIARMIEVMGLRGFTIFVVGCTLVALVLIVVTLLKRIKDPPIMLTLKPPRNWKPLQP